MRTLRIDLDGLLIAAPVDRAKRALAARKPGDRVVITAMNGADMFVKTPDGGVRASTPEEWAAYNRRRHLD